MFEECITRKTKLQTKKNRFYEKWRKRNSKPKKKRKKYLKISKYTKREREREREREVGRDRGEIE